jgi:stage IV sporulation protein A
MIRADIETEIAPLVGSEKQSEELVNYLLQEFESDRENCGHQTYLGNRCMNLLPGLNNKLSRMPEDAQMKLQETLQKIINEGSGGLICIIL